jgi:hypothetical protein
VTRIGKFWTDAVAYIALTLGSGVSIAGNVADTYRTRGAATDGLDLFLAAFWPATVVLTVELFVNKRWVGLAWPMQVLRWAGCIAIGGMAMRVSWVHLNDLMASRGQKADVAILGPLAIDALAIMATALILAGRRGHGHMSADTVNLLDVVATGDVRGHGHKVNFADTDTMDSVSVSQDVRGHARTRTTDADYSVDIWATPDSGHADTAVAGRTATEEEVAVARDVRDREWPDTATPPSFLYETDTAVAEPPMATRPEGDLNAWQHGYERHIDAQFAEDLPKVEAELAKLTTDTLPQRERLSVPDGAVQVIKAWPGARSDLVKHVSGTCNVSTRTARRWISAVLGPDRRGGGADDR